MNRIEKMMKRVLEEEVMNLRSVDTFWKDSKMIPKSDSNPFSSLCVLT